MPAPIRSLAVLAAALLLTAATCGRPVVVESEGAAAVADVSYRLEVVNQTANDRSVYYGPPGSPTLLGTVGANDRETFVILSPPSPTIRILATAEGQESVERTVLLQEGSVVSVTLD